MSLDVSDSQAEEGGETPADGTAVEIENVTKQYEEVVAVDDVSIDIREQEFLTMLGPSGAGKTTLLHMIAGFVTPTEGTIKIAGEDVTNKPPYERNIGMVFQSMALFPHMNVAENIAFPLKMRRFDHDQIDDRVEEMLELIRLPDIGDRQISELSGGQQQRVAIARGLAFEPALLLLDEPLSSLDKKLREEMRHELMRIHREAEVTTVHVTHNQEEALTMADRIAVIKDGAIAQLTSAQELYSKPNSRFVADFVGNSNIFTGRVIERDNPSCTVALEGTELTVTCDTSITGDAVDENEDVDIGVRYENVQIGETLGTDNVYDATVEDVLFRGDLVNYSVVIDTLDQELFITELNQDTRVLNRGDAVVVGWNASDNLVYSRQSGE